MTKTEKDEYWMERIQQCRVSGMSDYAWCNQNGISLSSFYYTSDDYATRRVSLILQQKLQKNRKLYQFTTMNCKKQK